MGLLDNKLGDNLVKHDTLSGVIFMVIMGLFLWCIWGEG